MNFMDFTRDEGGYVFILQGCKFRLEEDVRRIKLGAELSGKEHAYAGKTFEIRKWSDGQDRFHVTFEEVKK